MKLSAIWSDGMVLQRGRYIHFAGYAQGNTVTAVFAGKTYQCEADDNGYFVMLFDPMKAGGPYELEIYDGSYTCISDIWIGDVWLIGGQSNMELPVSRTLDVTQSEVDEREFPLIREFRPEMVYDFSKERELYEQGSWKCADRRHVLDFSAAGYFFARNLYKTYEVPVGLISTGLGGTPAEAWMSMDAIEALGGYETAVMRNRSDAYVRGTQASDMGRIEQWHIQLDKADPGKKYSWNREPDRVDGSMEVPGMWKDTPLEGYKGSVWFSRSFDIPQSWCSEDGYVQEETLLRAGTVIDADETYVNGILAGTTAYRYPPRKYRLAPHILKAGRNVITIRVIADGSEGGFMPGKPCCIEHGTQSVRLAGTWSYAFGARMEKLEGQHFFQYEPSGVFNGMIAPLKNMQIKGILYYQGESNDSAPKGYAQKLKLLAESWRKKLNQGDLPFIYVQLPLFGDGRKTDLSYNWSIIRQEQEKCEHMLHNAVMVNAIDTGEYNDLHPQTKNEIGRRLALAARAAAYGENISYAGPRAQRAVYENGEVIVNFPSAEMLVKDRECLAELVYADGKSQYLVPEIRENFMIIRNTEEQLPIMVRYGWGNAPKGLGLFDETGNPAYVFSCYVECRSKKRRT